MPAHPILMIQTRNRRKYFTEAKNLPMLTEFAKTFGAQLSLVEVSDIDPLDIQNLAPAFCDDSYRSPKQGRNAKVLRQIYPKHEEFPRNRRSMRENAQVIREYIRTRLKKGSLLTVKDIKEKFSDLALSPSCISNHIAFVCGEMERSGLSVARIKAGSYRLQ